jgi:hypothetical protein
MATLFGNDAQTAVNDFYLNKGRLPANAAEAGYLRHTDPTSKWFQAVEVKNAGTVVITLNKDPSWPDGGEVMLIPAVNAAGNGLEWKCRSTLSSRLLPPSCQD